VRALAKVKLEAFGVSSDWLATILAVVAFVEPSYRKWV
jgi:hypothetical protein